MQEQVGAWVVLARNPIDCELGPVPDTDDLPECHSACSVNT